MTLASAEKELVMWRRRTWGSPALGQKYRICRLFTRNWAIISLILQSILKIFTDEPWSSFAILVGFPVMLYLLTPIISKLVVRIRQRRNLRGKYLTPADLPASMPFDFQVLYQEVGDKGTKLDREELQLLCTHVTVEALKLKAVGVPLDKPELNKWFSKKYTQACKLSKYIVDFDDTVTQSMVTEAARRKAEIERLSQEAALAAFRARNVEGPIDTADWTADGLGQSVTRLERMD